ncbi:hypothetical protein [Fructobacillus tropaeoli]|uniref:hypothetical protein n=1 Tax=Fructobacillus tropaeoli TaxID=709323 RepID=UPI002DA14163|nr:unnamed protein product [Fructobacillus tropaeoli]
MYTKLANTTIFPIKLDELENRPVKSYLERYNNQELDILEGQLCRSVFLQIDGLVKTDFMNIGREGKKIPFFPQNDDGTPMFMTDDGVPEITHITYLKVITGKTKEIVYEARIQYRNISKRLFFCLGESDKIYADYYDKSTSCFDSDIANSMTDRMANNTADIVSSYDGFASFLLKKFFDENCYIRG